MALLCAVQATNKHILCCHSQQMFRSPQSDALRICGILTRCQSLIKPRVLRCSWPGGLQSFLIGFCVADSASSKRWRQSGRERYLSGCPVQQIIVSTHLVSVILYFPFLSPKAKDHGMTSFNIQSRTDNQWRKSVWNLGPIFREMKAETFLFHEDIEVTRDGCLKYCL